jgi:multiple sugar transport system permease protein
MFLKEPVSPLQWGGGGPCDWRHRPFGRGITDPNKRPRRSRHHRKLGYLVIFINAADEVFYAQVSVNLMGWPQSSSWRAMVSSTIISTVATFFSVLIGLLAAFAISRYQLGRNFMTLQILSFRMVPPIAVAVPFAIIGTTIGATFTPVLLTLIYIAYTVPLATWMLKSFIDQTPPEIEEAAMMDGMSRWHAHFLVTLPMRRGGLAATILFVFILNWSEGAIALALAAGRYVTIPVQIADKVASPHVQVTLAVLAALPLLTLGYLIQNHLSRGFTFGAIKQ